MLPNKQTFLTACCLLLVTCLFILSSCEPKVDVPEPSTGNADFTRYVAIGNDFSSGFADGALSKQGQLASFPNLLAQQMRLVGGADTFDIPLLKGDKGTYPDDDYGPGDFKKTLPKFILVKQPDCKGEVNLLPERLPGSGDDEIDLDDDAQRIYSTGSVYQHLGIPAMKVIHFTSPGYGDVANYGTSKSFNPYFWRFAPGPLVFSSPYSYIDTSLFTDNKPAKPTFFTLELGMSDVLAYALEGGTGKVSSPYDDDITSVKDFHDNLEFILDYLVGIGAVGVVANIPDITTFPFFTTIEYDELDLSAGKADTMNDIYASNPNIGRIFHEGDHNPFVIKEDGVIRLISSTEFVLLGIDVDSLKCLDLGTYHPINDVDILSDKEIENIKTFTVQFNEIIASLAAERDLELVDLAGFIDQIYRETTIDGIDLSAEMVSGGFFSLDGLHPSDRGQALVANEFIKSINKKFGAQLPLLNISDYRGVLFP